MSNAVCRQLMPVHKFLSSSKGIVLFCLLLISSSLVQPSPFIAFGPKTYTRDTGKPAAITDVFSASNTATTYEIDVDSDGVASAVITLNGTPVWVESDFK